MNEKLNLKKPLDDHKLIILSKILPKCNLVLLLTCQILLEILLARSMKKFRCKRFKTRVISPKITWITNNNSKCKTVS